MKIKIAYLFALIALPLLAFAKPIATDELHIPISQRPITEQIDYFADKYGVDSSLMEKVVECESQGDPENKGDWKNGKPLAFGILQYHKESFERHAKIFGEELDYYSYYDQIKVGTWAISEGHGNEWTTYRAIKNGGTYSFYSNLLKEHYTVNCKL